MVRWSRIRLQGMNRASTGRLFGAEQRQRPVESGVIAVVSRIKKRMS